MYRGHKIPTYEYICEACEIIFEEVFIDPEDVDKYKHAHPCTQCDSIARRIVSATNFQFKGTPGNSGSHDLDYPTLDKAVGRSAEKKWSEFHENKRIRDKIRREAGQYAITQVGDSISPSSPETMRVREHAIKEFNRARKESGSSNDR